MPSNGLFTRAIGKNNPTGAKITDTYLSHLTAFWNGCYDELEANIADTLATTPDHPQKFPMYRLWIESLARRQNRHGLHGLVEHLGNMALAFNDETFSALRAIAHFELDEQQAVNLFVNALSRTNNNPYILELRQLHAIRNGETTLTLKSARVRILDYVHYLTMVQGIITSDGRRLLKNLLRDAQDHFPSSPLVDEVCMHLAWEENDLATAKGYAERLVTHFGANCDYLFFLGQILFEQGFYVEATHHLEKCIEISDAMEPDAHSLLTVCHQKLAALHSRLADEARVDNGLPTILLSEPTTRSNQNRVPRAWVVILSSAQVYEFCSRRITDLSSITLTLADYVQPGDQCFVASSNLRSDSNERHWQILAAYRVADRQPWNPLGRNARKLELIVRSPEPIPMDAMLEDRTNEQGNKTSIFELSAEALETLSHTLQQGSQGSRSTRNREKRPV